MSEEEKKIIDKINMSYDYNTQYVEASAEDWNVIVDLINKQQKEIEDLNGIKQQICNEELITQDHVLKNFIAKDKIIKKIEELENNYNEKNEIIIEKYSNNQFIVDAVSLLEELLEEE